MSTEELGMDDLLAHSVDVRPGVIVDGTVIGQSGDALLINVGLKQEAILPVKELERQIPSPGDVLPVYVVRLRGPEGRPLVSWRQARERKNWDKVRVAFEKKEVIPGKIVKRVKGGVTVDIGLDAFMPASQIDDKMVGDPGSWVGQDVKVIVLEMDRSKGNVLVSRRKVVEQEKALKRDETLKTLREGQVIQGKVTGLTNFGAFIDIGGIEGLLHISDISWNRLEKPQSVLKVGEELDVKVLKFDASTRKISLSRKHLLPHPWDGVETQFPIGETVKGKVSGIASFGAFVELAPGIEGLIHISELSWTDRVKRPQDLLTVGQEVEVKIVGLDRQKEKISLSLKRLGRNPWEEIAATYPLGSVIEGTVTHVAPFGAFIKVPLGIEALLKPQDYSWVERRQTLKGVLKPGETVKAVVLEINVDQEKMALGIKQMEKDPLTELRVGEAVTAKVTKVVDFGLFVKLESGLEGLIRSSELFLKKSMFSGEEASAANAKEDIRYAPGEEVKACVIKINKRERQLDLSIRRYEKKEEKALLKKYSGKDSRLTLGQTTGWVDDDED